jgi:hypothetical protein
MHPFCRKSRSFTQQNASKRKEVLSNILGLEMWAITRTAAEKKPWSVKWMRLMGASRDRCSYRNDLRKARLGAQSISNN